MYAYQFYNYAMLAELALSFVLFLLLVLFGREYSNRWSVSCFILLAFRSIFSTYSFHCPSPLCLKIRWRNRKKRRRAMESGYRALKIWWQKWRENVWRSRKEKDSALDNCKSLKTGHRTAFHRFPVLLTAPLLLLQSGNIHTDEHGGIFVWK